MSAEPLFSITTTEEGPGRVRIRVTGEVDLTTTPDVRAALRRQARAAREVLLDLGRVSFIDSSGISMLVGLDNESRQDGFGFGLVASPEVLRVVRLCDLEGRLPLRPR